MTRLLVGVSLILVAVALLWFCAREWLKEAAK